MRLPRMTTRGWSVAILALSLELAALKAARVDVTCSAISAFGSIFPVWGLSWTLIPEPNGKIGMFDLTGLLLLHAMLTATVSILLNGR